MSYSWKEMQCYQGEIMTEIVARTDIEKQDDMFYYIKYIDNKLCICVNRNFHRVSGKYKDEFGNPIKFEDWEKDYPEQAKAKKREENKLRAEAWKIYKQRLKVKGGLKTNGNNNKDTTTTSSSTTNKVS